ncbi:retinol dehydrogenase 12 [Biscogniauxia mediterranea]|nr:retinol dehydrogenase 12 [Biscogniauxia mediterranea]
MNTIKNTLGENLGGKAQSLSTHQFSLDDVPDLSGKVAVVTGGSEGIGYACTHTLLQHGIAQRAALGPDAAAAAARTRWIQCDLADWPGGQGRRRRDQAGRLAPGDILINNAGRGAMSFELTDYGVDRHMAVNHTSNAHAAAAPGDVRFGSWAGTWGRAERAVRAQQAGGDPVGAAHREDIYDAYPRAGVGHVGLEPPQEDGLPGPPRPSCRYAATCATESGLYICPTAVPEEGSALACDGALGDRLMELTEAGCEGEDEARVGG